MLKLIFFSLDPFPVCVMFSCDSFLFAMITNVGVSRYGDSWWSCRWWRCSYL